MSDHTIRRGPGWAESILVLLPSRLVLAGIFGTAAFFKVQDPQAFAFAIKAFELLDPGSQGHIIKALAFGIPWAEFIIAVLLVLGLWTRGAAGLLALMTLGFTFGLASLVIREMETECACFGKLEFLCTGAVGPCHLIRNSVLFLLSALLLWRGGGRLAVDRSPPAVRTVDSDEDAA